MMSKVLYCRDVGMDCDFVARADTEDELLQQAAVHAQAVHSVQVLPPELVAAVRAAIREA